MKALFEKWFCKHKWLSHNKESYQRETFQRVHGGERSLGKNVFTREVLICEVCGKIKNIEY